MLRNLLLTAAILLFTASPSAQDNALVTQLYKAVAILYSQNEKGDMEMRCTATAFDRTSRGYLFATAAHCIGSDDVSHERSAKASDIPFYLTFDEQGMKRFYPAAVKGVGYQHRGDDFAVFEVESLDEWPTIGIGDETKEKVGAEVYNVASPLGLGKQAFKGVLTSLSLDRPIVEGDINWKGSLLVSISVGPGSSGSAIVAKEQGKIVGFLVGTIQSGGTPNVIAIPATKFKKFWDAAKDGKYRFFAPEKD